MINSLIVGLDRVLLNAILAIALIVDDDVRILDYNAAAEKLFGDPKELVLNRRGSETLNCLHAHEVSQGCGHAPDCDSCIIHNSVNEAVNGTSIVRKRARLDLVHADKIDEVLALITASPSAYEGNQLLKTSAK